MKIERIIKFSIDGKVNMDNNILLCLPSLYNKNIEYIRKFSKDNYINDKYGIDYRNINYRNLLNKVNNNKFYSIELNFTDKDLIQVRDLEEERQTRMCKYGYTNLEGDLVIPCMYDKASVFVNGIALVMKDNQYYYIDKNNNIIKEVDSYNMNDFIEFANDYNFYYKDGKCTERITKLDFLCSVEYIELNGIVAYDIVNSNVYMVSDYEVYYKIISNNRNIIVSSDEISDLTSNLIKLENKDKKLLRKKKNT